MPNMLDPLVKLQIADHGTVLPSRGTLDVQGGLVAEDDPIAGVTKLSGGGGFTPGGDLDGDETEQTVIGLQGRPVDSGAPTIGHFLYWNGTSWSPGQPATFYDSIVRGSFQCEGAPQGYELFSMTAAPGFKSTRLIVDWASTSNIGIPFSRSGHFEATIGFQGSLVYIEPSSPAPAQLQAVCYDGEFAFACGGDRTDGGVVGFTPGPPDTIQRLPVGREMSDSIARVPRPTKLISCGEVGYTSILAALDNLGNLYVLGGEDGLPVVLGLLTGLRFIDISSPGDGTLYAIAYDYGASKPKFYAIDISDPRAPAVDGTPLQLSADSVLVSAVSCSRSGDHAYVCGFRASGVGGRLYILDISGAPSLTNTFESADVLADGKLLATEANGRFAWQAKSGVANVRGINCNDPMAPVLKTHTTGFSYTVDLFENWDDGGGKVYVLDATGWVATFDITDPINPVIATGAVSYFDQGGLIAAGFFLRYGYPGEWILAATTNGRFLAINVDTPAAPVLYPQVPGLDWAYEPDNDGSIWFMSNGGEAGCGCCCCCCCCEGVPRYVEFVARWVTRVHG